MKNILKTLTVFIITSLLSVTAFAMSAEDILRLEISDYEADLKAIAQDTGETLTVNNSYPLYVYDASRDPTLPINEKLFDSCIWNKVLIPEGTIIESRSGGRWQKNYSFDTDAGKWQNSGSSSVPTFTDSDGNTIAMDFSLYGLAKIASEKISEQITDFKIIYFENNYLLYVVSSNNEYIIPYSSRSDFSGLENGKVYDAKTAEQTLLKNLGLLPTENAGKISTESINIPGDYTVGGGTANAQKPYTAVYIITAVTALAIAVTAIIMIKKKRRA